MVFFSFLLFLGRVYHAKDACEPATGVSDMIPGALRPKSMVRSRELTDEGLIHVYIQVWSCDSRFENDSWLTAFGGAHPFSFPAMRP